MQNNDALGSRPPDGADWSNAFAAVSRLAAIRDLALRDIGHDQNESFASDQQTEASSTGLSAEQIDPLDPDQLARAVAEIEKASSALRKSEPALEAWSPNNAATSGITRKYWSIWLLIGGIWISATLVVAGAAGAILYLLG
jgi:hypothetical protein